MSVKKIANLFLIAVVFLLISSSTVLAQDSESGKMNINTATIEQLSTVPGLTSDLAQKIVDYRNDMGDITDMEELLDIDGFSKDILDQIKEKIGVEGIEGSDCTC